MNEFYDILGDYYPDGVGATDSSAMRRVLKSGSIFFMSSSGEHMMQSQAFIAILVNTKTYDSGLELYMTPIKLRMEDLL